MARFQSVDEIYSVLYVDFDNIYTRLFELEPALARTFATNPQRWMRWLEGHALRMMYGDGIRRRILKRCCYLNPLRFHEFRPFFIRSAFQVVDCPPLTNYGKTSADIHLVMDCMDALAHATRFDEFIILSGDADFTPLLLRIQEHARRSLVLSVGYTSPAYAAACSWRIREDWFISQALEESRSDEDEKTPERYSDTREPRSGGYTPPRPAPAPERAPAETPPAGKEAGVQLPAYKRVHLVESIKQLVAESQVPVPLPSVSQVLQSEQEAPADWYGAGTLRELLEMLDLAPVLFTPVGQGYVYDPERHERPVDDGTSDAFRQNKPKLYEFALNIHRLTDLPLLSPAQYTALLTFLIEEVRANGFARTSTVQALEDHCEAEGLPINATQIAFVVEAVIRGGVHLAAGGKSAPSLTLAGMRQALGKSALELCKLSQITLDRDGMRMLSDWLQSDGSE